MPLHAHSPGAARMRCTLPAAAPAEASLFVHCESLATCRAIAQTRSNFLLLPWPTLGFLFGAGLAPAGIYAVLSILRRQMIHYHGAGVVGPVPVNTAALARECNVSERSIQREIRKAEGLGLLKRRLRRTQCRSSATLMEVALPNPESTLPDQSSTLPDQAAALPDQAVALPDREASGSKTEIARPDAQVGLQDTAVPGAVACTAAPAVVAASPVPVETDISASAASAALPGRRPRVSLASRIRQVGASNPSTRRAPDSDKNGAAPTDKSGVLNNNRRTQSETIPARRSAGSAQAPDAPLASGLFGAGCRIRRGNDRYGSPGYWVETAAGAGFVIAESPRFDTVAGHAVQRLRGVKSLPEICALLQQFEYTLRRKDHGRPVMASLNGLIKLALQGRWSAPHGYANYLRHGGA